MVVKFNNNTQRQLLFLVSYTPPYVYIRCMCKHPLINSMNVHRHTARDALGKLRQFRTLQTLAIRCTSLPKVKLIVTHRKLSWSCRLGTYLHDLTLILDHMWGLERLLLYVSTVICWIRLNHVVVSSVCKVTIVLDTKFNYFYHWWHLLM